MQAPAAHDEVHLSALGVPIGVSITGSRAHELASAMRHSWEWCAAGTGSVPDHWLSVALGVADATSEPLDVTGDDLDLVMEHIASLVTKTAVDAKAGDLLMLHANALADPITGRTITMVGPSQAGKTTAAVTLTSGRSYLTDETLAVDAQGHVVPYPKPLSVRRDGGRTQVLPSTVGALRPPDQPCIVQHVLLVQRDETHVGEPRVEHVPVVQALAETASETSHLADLDRGLHRLALLFEHDRGALRVTYNDAGDLEGLVASLLTS